MEDAKTVRYVSKDPIQNLKIRVTLWRLSVHRPQSTVNPDAINQAQQAQAQAQALAQGQAQAQALVIAQAQAQQPFPLPLGPDGQPVPAGGAPTGVTLPQASVAGAATQAGQAPQAVMAQQQPQAQYVNPPQQAQQPMPQPQPVPMQAGQQAHYMGTTQQQQPYSQPGPQAGQAVAESFDVARPGIGPGPGPGPSARPPGVAPGGGGGNGAPARGMRQRMTVQERLDAAAETEEAGVPLMPAVARAGAPLQRGGAWQQPAAGAAAVDDPFAALGPGGDGGWGHPPPRRHGRPLGEAIEHPGDGSGDGSAAADGGSAPPFPTGRRRRQQRLASEAAASQQGVQPPGDEQQQGAPPAPADPQQLQPGPAQGQPQPLLQPQFQAQQGQPGASSHPGLGLNGIVIPPQPVVGTVWYDEQGPEARMAAMGELPEVPPTTEPHKLPEKYKTSRVFGWQEKVYSRMEVARAQAAAAQAAQTAQATAFGGPVAEAILHPASAGGHGPADAASGAGTSAGGAPQAYPAGTGPPGSAPPPGAAGLMAASATVQMGPMTTTAPTPAQGAFPGPVAAAPGAGYGYAPGAQAPGAAEAVGAVGVAAPEPQLMPQPQFAPAAQAGQQQQQAGAQQQQQRNKRLQAFGSTSALDNKQLDLRTPGSILFTYVQSDEFCIAQELGRTVTTSDFEGENFLVNKLLTNAKGRQQVLTFRSMYIVADLGEEGDVADSNDKLLVSIRAFPDGSFDMCPGFSKPGVKYRFEDKHGGIYEYTVEHASPADIPSLERRTAKLERAVVARAEELRRAALKTDFELPPADDCTRLLLLGEIQSAAGFPRDRLYVEYVVRWDPERWDLVTAWPQQEPGIVQGVTHISRVTVYPAEPLTDTPARDVAHFAHPLELEWVSRGAQPPPSNQYPVLFFQVCTMDPFNRYTSEGYGWLSLNGRVPGSGTHVVRTWKPLGTIRDQQAEFFVGGSAELADLAYLTTPSGFNGRILNKYGFKTESIGALKVRLNTVTQRFNPDIAAGGLPGALRRSGASGSPGPHRGGALGGGAGAGVVKRNKKDMSLEMVVERARQRLREARGTDELPGGARGEVAVRPGVVAEAPTILVHPQDAVVAEESTVRLKVVARGLPPLKYEWYKDDRRLVAATADKPELILVQVSLESEGSYYCQVSNKDGSVNSSKASLTVTRAARVSRATAAEGGGGEGRNPPRRPARTGATSPGSASGAGGGRAGGVRMSRLARLDADSNAARSAAAAAGGGGGGASGSVLGSETGPLSPTEGGAPSQTSGGGGSAGGAGTSPRVSSAGAERVAGPPGQPVTASGGGGGGGGGPSQQQQIDQDPPLQLPPPAFAQPRPAAGGGNTSVRGGGAATAGGLPPDVAAAATGGFQRRPARAAAASATGSGGVGDGGGGGGGSSGGGAAGGGASEGGAGEPDGQDDVSVVEPVARPRPRRIPPAPGTAQPAPPPASQLQQRQQQAPPPQQQQQRTAPGRAPMQRQQSLDDGDLEAEEIL